MVKPIQALVLLSYILITLILFSFLFPKNNKLFLVSPTVNEKGDTISDGFAINFFEFKNVFITDTLSKTKDISNTVALAEKLQNIQKKKVHKIDSSALVVIDSLSLKLAADTIPTLDIEEIQQLLSDKYRIQFPENQPNALHSFFKSLNFLKKDSSLIRILHYGDSQIEGDRISSHLRDNFQKQFGGCGVGLVPVFDAVGKSTIFRKKSNNWNNYLVFGHKYNKKNPNNYGLTGSYFSYTKIPRSKKTVIIPDSLKTDSLVKKDTIKTEIVINDSLLLQKFASQKSPQAWFEYSKGWKRHGQMAKAEQITLLYGNVYAPNFIQISTKTDTLDSFLLKPSKGLHLKKYSLSSDFNKIKVTIKGKKSPQIYGMAFDGKQGIAVDNIGFRGSSGTEFVRMDMKVLAEEIKKMNIKLLVLQFGVNVAAGKELSSYDYYQKMFSKQLKLLKKADPNLSILVVSLSDMAYKQEGVLTTRPSVEKVRDAQRNAAFENGCAFWDLYEAMGGYNSMVSWVEAKPSLAKSDYTHFNRKGAELVGEMLYNALIIAYAKHNKLIQ